MSSSLTSRLKLHKADPGTGEPVDVAKLNQSMDKIDAGIGPADVTSTTRPATPYANQMIRESDTRALYVRNNTDGRWDQILVAGPRFNSPVELANASASGVVSTSWVNGENNPRLYQTANGTLTWGGGAVPGETNLYRSAANLLATDDAFSSGGYRLNGALALVMTTSNEVSLGSAMNSLSTSEVDVTGVTLSVTSQRSGAILMVWYTFDFSTSAANAGTSVGKIHVGGTTYGDSQAIFNGGNTTAGTRATVSNFKRVVLGAAGSYTVKLRAQAGVAASVNLQASHTKMSVQLFE